MARLVILFLLVGALFSSCHESISNPNKELTLEYFSGLSDGRYTLKAEVIRKKIYDFIRQDGIALSADRQVREYYKAEMPLIWVDREGVRPQADTLLSIIRKAENNGVSTRMLRVTQISDDIECLRNLNIVDGDEDINVVMARVEYNLTRAYLRYTTCLRFGLVNPDHLYNNLEKDEADTLNPRYLQLSDLRVERPDRVFYSMAIGKAFNGGISEFVTSIMPKGQLYDRLLERLNDGNLSASEKIKTLCNIERCRWRLKAFPDRESLRRYVEVNIPSYSLRAADADSVMTMRVVCGAIRHKSPLLSSRITRMDINPQWIVPKSIAKGFIGNIGYMRRMGMFVYDRKLGKLPVEHASYEKMMAGEQFIIQAGGPKNSLGRIIFRFDNNFSVFLHDTSSPHVFSRASRAVSHGCIRVEKPYELALFVYGKHDAEIEDRLEYSMTVDFGEEKDTIDVKPVNKKRLIRSLPVKPAVPIFISYYTIYFDAAGQLVDYNDIYGYDEALAGQLKPFVD